MRRGTRVPFSLVGITTNTSRSLFGPISPPRGRTEQPDLQRMRPIDDAVHQLMQQRAFRTHVSSFFSVPYAPTAAGRDALSSLVAVVAIHVFCPWYPNAMLMASRD
jgi:hypothetical protein